MKIRAFGNKNVWAGLVLVLIVCLLLTMTGLILSNTETLATERRGATATAFASGDGSKDNPYRIADAEQLRLLSGIVNGSITQVDGKPVQAADYNNPDVYYRLTDDIHLNDPSERALYGSWSEDYSPRNRFTPIGTAEAPFCSQFDGGGYTILGAYVYEQNIAGIFGVISSDNPTRVTVQNLSVKESFICSVDQDAGGIAARLTNNAELVNCDSSAKVVTFAVQSASAGGIAGVMETNGEYGPSVTSCVFEGSLTGKARKGEYVASSMVLGGVVGKTLAPNERNNTVLPSITHSVNRGSVGYEGDRGALIVGGVVGSAEYGITITDSGNEGRIFGDEKDTARTGYAGGVIGRVYYLLRGTVARLYNTGDVITPTLASGGIFGQYYLGSYEVQRFVLEDFFNSGDITGKTVGGFIGRNSSATSLSQSIFKNIVNFGRITSSGSVRGEIVGEMRNSIIVKNFISYDRSGAQSYTGEFRLIGKRSNDTVGFADGYAESENIMIPRTADIQEETTYQECGAEIYFVNDLNRTHKNKTLSNGESKNAIDIFNHLSRLNDWTLWQSAGAKLGYTASEFSYSLPESFARFAASSSAWRGEEGSYDAFEGSGTTSDPYIIKSAYGLYTLRRIVSHLEYLGRPLGGDEWNKYAGAGVVYKLGADIYLNDVSAFDTWDLTNRPPNLWTPIGSSERGFGATFDGNGYSIYGMYVDGSAHFYAGLFGYVNNTATLVNITVKNSVVTAETVGGGIVGHVSPYAKVLNCKFEGKVYATQQSVGAHMGGIAGYSKIGSLVENCVADVSMTSFPGAVAVDRMGGIVGVCEDGVIADSQFYGRIDAGYGTGGGICGVLAGVGITKYVEMRDCTSYGTITSNLHAGGIVGIASSSVKITGCTSAPSVSVELNVINNESCYAGGIAGYWTGGGEINGCVSSAQINIPAAVVSSAKAQPLICIGGIVGSIEDVSKSLQLKNSRTTQWAAVNYSNPFVEQGTLERVITVGGVAGKATASQRDGAAIAVVSCTNEMTLNYVQGIPQDPLALPHSGGIIGYADCGASTKIFNNVNFSQSYEYGIGYSLPNQANTAFDMSNNYSVYSEGARLLNDHEALVGDYKNNLFFDAATGGLVNADGTKVSYRGAVSGILCTTLDEVVNSNAIEFNMNESEALSNYFEPSVINGVFLLKRTEVPIFFVRFIAQRPDDIELDGGFFIANMSKTYSRDTLNGLPVAYEGFTLQNWTYTNDAKEEAAFDFDTRFDRNYTLKADYTMDIPEISPTEDIDCVYDGKTHEIRLNADIRHSLGEKYWAIELSSSQVWVEKQDGYGFTNSQLPQKYRYELIMEHTDRWEKKYHVEVSHTFNVSISKAPLTVTGLYAQTRQYNGASDVDLLGGELIGVMSNDAGELDDVRLKQLPTKGKLSDKNAGKNKPVTFDDIQVEGRGLSNYAFVQPVVTAEITAAQISLNGVRAIDKEYDGSRDITLAVNGFMGILGTDDVSFHPGATVAYAADKNVGNAKTVQVEKIALSGADAGNYVCVLPSGLTVNITPKQLSILDLYPAYQSRTYDRTRNIDLVGGYLSGIVAGDEVDCVMPSVGTVATKNVGTNKIVSVTLPSLSGKDAANYTVAVANDLYIDVVPKDVSIVDLKAVDRYYNKTSVVELTSNGLDGFIEGDNVSFSVPTSGTIGEIYVGVNKPVSISWGTMQGTDAINYNIVLPEQVTVNITPKPLSIEGITAIDKEYDGKTEVALSAAGAVLRGVESGDNVSFKMPSFAYVETTDAGFDKEATITGIQLISETDESILKNYTIGKHTVTVNVLPRSIDVVWSQENSFVYNGQAQAPVAQAETGVNGEFAVLGISGAQTNVGEAYTATAVLDSITGGNAENYTLRFATTQFSVTARDVTVSINQTVAFTEGSVWSNNVWNGNVKGLAADHKFYGTVETVDGIVGTYESGSGGFVYRDIAIRDGSSVDVTDNYNIVYDLSVVITRGEILYTVNNYIGVYDGKGHSIALNVVTEGAVVEYGIDEADFTSELPLFTDAGDYTVYFRISASNHTTRVESAKVSISPAELTVTLTAEGGIYNGQPFAAQSQVRDNYEDVEILLRYTGRSNGGVEYDETAAPVAAGQYFVTASVDNANYTLAHTSKSFMINRAEASISVDQVQTQYVYTGQEQKVDSGAELSHGETELVYTDNTFVNVGSGSYTVIVWAEQTDNYLAARQTVVINVARAVLTDASVGYDEIYDGKHHGISVAATGFLGTDDMNAAVVEYSREGTDWQSEPILVKNVNDSTAVHYRMTFADYEPVTGVQAIDVTAKELSIEGVSGGSQVYNQTNVVSQVSGGQLIGVMTGDVVHPVVPRTGTMDDKHAGKDKKVTIEAITLQGADASNYILIQPQVCVTVTPYVLSVQGLSVEEKRYDGTDEITVSVKGASLFTPFNGDDVQVQEVEAFAVDANVGRKNIVVSAIVLVGTEKDDYVVTLPTGLRGVITPKPLDFELTAKGGTYNGEPFGAKYTIGGMIGTDNVGVTLSYAGTTNGGVRYESESAPYFAGAYTVTALLDNDNYTLGDKASGQFVIDRAEASISVDQVQTQYVYTGQEQKVDSGAELSHGETELVYTDNTFVNVGSGSYTVTVWAAQTDNYKAAQKEIVITVAKARYDMSQVRLTDQTSIADGNEHGITISGQLPQGVRVEYVGNGQREAGVYTVRAVFIGDTENYEPIEEMSATLTLRSTNLAGSDGVEVSCEAGFDPDVALTTEEKNTEDYAELQLDGKELSALSVKDIALTKNGQGTNIGGKMKVRMLIDEALRGRDDLMVVYIAPDGSVVDMNAVREGDYMVFETDHNSLYAIVAWKNGTLSAGAIVGIVLGVVGILVIVLAVLLLRRRKEDNDPEEGDGGNDDGSTDDPLSPSQEVGDGMQTDDGEATEDILLQSSEVDDDTQSDEDEATEDILPQSQEVDDDTQSDDEELTEDTLPKSQEVEDNAQSDDGAENREIAADVVSVEEDRVSQTSESAAPHRDNTVVFVPAEQSLDAAFNALSREQKDFYERLRGYALGKEGITCNKTQTGETFKSGRKSILKLSIKRGTTVASFSLTHPILKQYKKQSGENEGDAIKIKPTEVFVSGIAAFNAAKDMIDIVIKQLQMEKEEALQKRKEARKSKSKNDAQNPQ